MCQEFHCECCPDDLPQISCVCVDCHHDDKPETPGDKSLDQPDDSEIEKAKKDCQEEVNNQKLLLPEEKLPNGAPRCCGDDNVNTTGKSSCCTKGDSGKPCISSEADKLEQNRKCCSTGDNGDICQESPQNVSPCSSVPGSSSQQKEKCCSAKKTDQDQCQRSSSEDVAKCCSSSQQICNESTPALGKESCCSSKKTGEQSRENDHQKVSPACCTSGQESVSANNMLKQNESCCSTKNKSSSQKCCSSNEDSSNGASNAVEQIENCCLTNNLGATCQKNPQKENEDQCCSSLQKDLSEETNKLKLNGKECCTTKKSDDVRQKSPSQGVTKCCSSGQESSFTLVNEIEQEDQCCSAKTNKQGNKEQSNVLKPSCCSLDTTSPKEQENGSTCCSAKSTAVRCNGNASESSSSLCTSEMIDERKSQPVAEDTCCAAQQDSCQAKDEDLDLPIDKASQTKEETVLLIDPVDDVSSNPKASMSTTIRKNTTKLRVQNICCAMEAKLVEECLKPLEGVDSVAVNVIGRVVHVRHNPEVTSPTQLVNCLNRVHLGATVMEMGAQQDKDDERMPRLLKLSIVYVLIQAALLVTAVTGLFLKQSWYKWIAITEMIFGGAPILKNSIISVKNRRVDINILMLIAIIGTVAISEWVEGATVVFVFAVSDVLQNFCMYRVQRTISKLMLKRPEIAVLAETGESVRIESVAIGTLIAVRPGELIPLDGVVVKGRAAIDESSITGESLPVEKTVMSKVYSGTVNQNGYIEVETTSDSSSSTVSKVAQMVQEAQSSSTKTEAIINRFAKYYTPLVVLIAALLVTIPAILGASGVGTYLEDIREWGRRALVMLVIACPCALVMATPIAVVTSITAAARKGALVKGGEHLETLANLKIMAFDKTGTLTEGKFQVTNMESESGENERDILRLAAGLESKTVHPISAAIVNEFSGCVAEMVKSQTVSLPEVTQFQMHEGQGISGVIEGKRVQVGNREMVDKCGASLSEYMMAKYQSWSNESKTVVFVCIDEKVSLMIALADAIRPNTSDSLDWLRDLGVQTSMITGDNSRTAEAVKSQLSVDECVSEMKPHDKLDWIKQKQTHYVDNQSSHLNICCYRSRDKHVVVGMVGDGVNDGPALASANVGIAMGAGGTALAVEAADVALMSNNLAKIPELITLSKFCNGIIKQNIVMSVLLKVVIVVVALCGYVALWMAVVADVVGLLLVILNGLRPLSWKAPKSQRKTLIDIELGLKKKIQSSYSYESIA